VRDRDGEGFRQAGREEADRIRAELSRRRAVASWGPRRRQGTGQDVRGVWRGRESESALDDGETAGLVGNGVDVGVGRADGIRAWKVWLGDSAADCGQRRRFGYDERLDRPELSRGGAQGAGEATGRHCAEGALNAPSIRQRQPAP